MLSGSVLGRRWSCAWDSTSSGSRGAWSMLGDGASGGARGEEEEGGNGLCWRWTGGGGGGGACGPVRSSDGRGGGRTAAAAAAGMRWEETGWEATGRNRARGEGGGRRPASPSRGVAGRGGSSKSGVGSGGHWRRAACLDSRSGGARPRAPAPARWSMQVTGAVPPPARPPGVLLPVRSSA